MDTGFIKNKVAESGIITLDLADYLCSQPIKIFDLKPFLFMGLILKEKDYREALKQINWYNEYANCIVGIQCTADAIVPVWAYMLAAQYLQPVAKKIYFNTEDFIAEQELLNNLQTNILPADFIDKRVVVKGCGEKPIPVSAYVLTTSILTPVVKSLMYGEPCSTVPVYKKPKV